jgi:hypothetical protein
MAEGEKFIELVLFPQISDTVKQGKGTETICLAPVQVPATYQKLGLSRRS